MIRTKNSAVKFLERYVPTKEKKHPGELGLLRMRELITHLDNPQLRYPTIHVGGTSGKGSTATIIASILATRFKVGLHTSPHLVKINERITYYVSRITKTISDKEFISLVNSIVPVVEKMEKGRYGAPSYFEIVTAMAFLYFVKKKVDIAVIEVGMGGRFDATNVINPVVAVITNVGLDHTEILGETVEEIAQNKAGIIKPGIRVVSGVRQPSVVKIITSKCKEQKARLLLLGKDFHYRVRTIGETGSVFDYQGELTINNLQLRLLGKHQVENATLAISTIEHITNNIKQKTDYIKQLTFNEEDVRRGLRDAYIQGRLEIVKRNPTVILDGAHNPDKMRALVEAIRSIWELNRVGPWKGPTLTKTRKVIAIAAIKEDKNAKEMLEILVPICWKIILTQYKVKMDQGEIVSFPPEELKRIIIAITGSSTPGESFTATPGVSLSHTVHDALDRAVKSADGNGIILVTGSLYLVGEIKKFTNNSN